MQRQRQVDRRGGFAHPTLAGGDHKDVADPLYRRQLLRARHTGHLYIPRPVDAGRPGGTAQPRIEGFFYLFKQGLTGKGQHQLDGQGLPLMLHGSHKTGCDGQDLFY